MKNVREAQLKKAICLTNEEFAEIIHQTLGDDVTVEISLEGVCISTKEDVIYWDKITKALANYFEVKEVTSVHADDCDYPIGIWIIYKD